MERFDLFTAELVILLGRHDEVRVGTGDGGVQGTLLRVAGDEGGPVYAASVACFLAAVAVFLRWRRKLRASVFDREEKTGPDA